jgi:hypothetical protein
MNRARNRIRPSRITTTNGANGKANGVNHRPAVLSVAPSETVGNGKAPETAPAPKPPAEGKTADGRFARGNSYGKGNPFSRKLGANRTAFLGAVSEADIAAVAAKLLELAKAGDLAAAQLFLSYAVGKPAPSVNADTLDLEEMGLLLRYPASEIEQHALLEGAGAPSSVAAIKERAMERIRARDRRFAAEEGDDEEE